jgi:predicted O-linked N-acetylglucosamine transferase (SPINDLY family)
VIHREGPHRHYAFASGADHRELSGLSGTMGSGICDYLVTDRFLTPPESASDYAEAFAYMPNSYHPHGRRSPIGCKPTRQEVELPEAGIVFCCFNQAYKITPEVFDI